MRKFRLGVDFVTSMAILLEIAKKNLKRQMLKRKKINGLKSKKQENQGRDLKRKENQ